MLGFGLALGGAMAVWGPSGWSSILAGVVVFVWGVVGLVWRGGRKPQRWKLENLKKGARAEERVGDVIEYALTADDCAVAHGVTDIAKVGDIDHLVATPVRLWVVETKHGRMPERAFSETLRRIADNVRGVREWAPGVAVSGCLVFGGDRSEKAKSTYSWGTEHINCFRSPESLLRELRAEARMEGTLGRDLVQKVWALGKVEEPAARSVARP